MSKETPIEKQSANEKSVLHNIIGVISGKGGVGKSYTTGLLAVALARQGFRVGILDGDVTGPSIPHLFNINEGVYGDAESIYPAITKLLQIKVISSSLLLTQDEDPIMWRGPLIGDLVTQFFTVVNWGELDYLLIDFPPGTSDVALSAFSNIPLNGLILVSTPQQMVHTIVKKAVRMADEMKVPMLGVIENMAYVMCNKCDEKMYLFGESNLEKLEKDFGLTVLGQIPFNPSNTKLLDEGKIEISNSDQFDNIVTKLVEVTNHA